MKLAGSRLKIKNCFDSRPKIAFLLVGCYKISSDDKLFISMRGLYVSSSYKFGLKKSIKTQFDNNISQFGDLDI